METGVLYKIKRNRNRNGQDLSGGIILKGAGVDIQVLGSESQPEALADMVDIAGEQLTPAGAYPFALFPSYIYFVGTATTIELVNYIVDVELGGLS